MLISYWMAGMAGGWRFLASLGYLLVYCVAAHSIGLSIGAIVMDGKRAAVCWLLQSNHHMFLSYFSVFGSHRCDSTPKSHRSPRAVVGGSRHSGGGRCAWCSLLTPSLLLELS